MLFSFSEFQKTKKQLLQEFKSKPPIDVSCYEWDKGFNQYRKILNSLKFGKTNKLGKCKSAKRLQSACFNRQLSKTHRAFQKLNVCQTQQNFYLTEAVDADKNKENVGNSFQAEQQNDQLYNLIIKITGQTNNYKNLQTQIRQLESSIRFYKQENKNKELQLNKQGKRQLIMSKLVFKNQNQLNAVTFRNNQFKDKMINTQQLFAKSFKSIKVSIKNGEKNSNQLLDEIAQNILTANKRRQIIVSQKKLMDELKKEQQQKKQNIKIMKKMFMKAKNLITTNQLNKFIRSNGYGKIQSLKSLCPNQSALSTIEQTNIIKISKQIIKIFKKMKSDEEKLKQIYQFRILQKKQLQGEYKNGTKLNQFHESQQNNIGIQLNIQEDQRQIIIKKNQQSKMKNYCDTLLGMEERSKFFAKKLLLWLILLVQNWLKYDEQAIKFLNKMINKFVSIQAKPGQTLLLQDLKTQLIQYFQKWKSYLFFCEEISKNSLLYRSFSRKKLIDMFKRIIKTKTHNPQFETQDIFTYSLKQLFDEKTKSISKAILQYIKISSQIFQYASKYQVLIVNLLQHPEKFNFVKKQQNANPYLFNIRKKQNDYEKYNKVDEQEIILIGENRKKTNQTEEVPNLVTMILAYQEELNKISTLNKKSKKPKYQPKVH